MFSGTIANFLGLLLPLLLGAYSIPLIIDRLGIERFGTLTIIWALVGYLGLLDFGISRALTKRIAEAGKLTDVGRIVRPGLILMFGLGVLTAIILSGGYFFVNAIGILRADPELHNSVCMISLSMPLVLVSLGQRGILEGRQRFGATNWGRVVLGIATFGMPIFLLGITPRLDVLVAALVGGRVVVLLMQGWACRNELRASIHAPFDHHEMLDLMRFGGWMTVSNLVSPLMVFLDRFIIGASGHAPNLAYYTTPFEVVTRLLIVPGAVTTVLFPRLSQWGRDSPFLATQGMIRGMGLNFSLVAPMVLGVQLFAVPLLDIWLGNDFAAHGAAAMRYLALGVLFNSLAQFPFVFLQGIGKPRLIALLHLVELPLYLLMLFFLLQHWGITGVAVAWLIRAAVDGVALVTMSSVYANTLQRLEVAKLFVFALLLGVAGVFVNGDQMEKLALFGLLAPLAAAYGWRIARSDTR